LLRSQTGAKRIGLLFSGAEIDYELDSKYIKDIPDIKDGDELFSDGTCFQLNTILQSS